MTLAPVLVLAMLAAVACGRPARPTSTTITDRDWELVLLADDANPRGDGGRSVTLRLDAASGRAVGFAGCNRFSAGYVLKGDHLTFDPPISTRMACAEGMELERRFLATLPSLSTWQATDATLVLGGADGLVLRFRAP